MIELYVAAGGASDSSRAERIKWGVLEDGKVVTDHTDDLPEKIELPATDLHEYVQFRFDATTPPTDPIATLEAHQTGPVIAAVPSTDGARRFAAGEYVDLVEDGDLTDVELKEVRRYRYLGAASVSPEKEPAKAYRHSDIFSHVLMYSKEGQGNYTQIGIYHPDSRQVVADPTGKVVRQVERFRDEPGVRVDNVPSIVLAPSSHVRCWAYDPTRRVATRDLEMMQNPSGAEPDRYAQPSLRKEVQQELNISKASV